MTSLDRRSFIACTSGALAAFAHQWAVTEPAPSPRWTPRPPVDTLGLTPERHAEVLALTELGDNETVKTSTR
ncbi:hypothetical protein QR97_36505 [Streptomyces sp. PBH53]|nr:hypothetical protein QR97_36505 [Streptomyces sp. PBH53]